MLELINEFLLGLGLSQKSTGLNIGVAVIVLVVAYLSYLLVKWPLLSIVKKVVAKTKTHWDDVVIKHRVVERFAYLLPAMIVYQALPEVFAKKPTLLMIVEHVIQIYVVLVGVLLISAVLNTLIDISERINAAWNIPFKMFANIVKLLVFFSAAILIVAILINKSPLMFFSGLGAFTAVLMLVFKDSILGFVAGIQIAMNDMLAKGDWLEMPQYGADGTVKEIGLTTIKIQNFDMTISTIPTYALISESFKNWRGMQNSGGRRIKRAINIDLNSVSFVDANMLKKFSNIELISDYVAERSNEIDEYNKSVQQPSIVVNNRKMTNIGTFRMYVENYIKQHPMSHKEMTILVRQLAPNKNGLPIEVYFFSVEKAWVKYEAIQADIFDHLLAILPEFGLRVFQEPSGQDFRKLV